MHLYIMSFIITIAGHSKFYCYCNLAKRLAVTKRVPTFDAIFYLVTYNIKGVLLQCNVYLDILLISF